MDRQTLYFGQVPLETDQLKQSQNTMVGLAKFCAAVLGSTTIVNGFTCTPTTPASLNVLLTAGEIYQIANLEATNWSTLTADTAHSILKQGILLDALTFGITPPGTVGFSQNFLVEVQYADSDTGSTVLPYYSAASPNTPFSGPANSGTAQNTVRKGIVAAQVKAGVAAATGTQTTPTADAGWTGLFVVTVANGATTITSGNITQLSSAPFLPVTLPNVPKGVQTSAWTYCQDTSVTSNAIIATLSPQLTSYVAGTRLSIKVANANSTGSGATTINVNGLGTKSVTRWDGSALLPNQLQPGMIIDVEYDGTNFQWLNQYMLRLNGPLDYYVNAATGNDANSGLSAGSPLATIQTAIAKAFLWDWNNNQVTIHVADGSYTGPISVGQTLNGIGVLKFIGNSTTPANVVVTTNNASGLNLYATARTPVTVDGFKFITTGTAPPNDPAHLIWAHVQSILTLRNIEYGASVAAHIGVDDGAQVVMQLVHRVVGNAPLAHMYLTHGGSRINFDPGNPMNMTIPVAVNVGVWAQAGITATIEMVYGTLTGAANVTGQKYSINSNAVLLAQGTAGSFPGTTAGAFSTGGQVL